MYNIKTDRIKNRLYVSLNGFFSFEEMKKCVNETIEETKKLRHGYDVITDISQFKPGSEEVTKEIERAQKHFAATGVTRGVRIVGASTLSGFQFTRTGSHAGYSSTNVATMEEAERILNEK